MLTLDKLAPYLPYKLKVDYLDKTVIMNAGSGSSKNWIGITALIQRKDKCKPILRPMSDLSKPFLVRGLKPTDIICQMVYSDNGTVDDIRSIMNALSRQNKTRAPYWVIEMLIKWHFDVFGLIESGDAIDINTLKK